MQCEAEIRGAEQLEQILNGPTNHKGEVGRRSLRDSNSEAADIKLIKSHQSIHVHMNDHMY